MSRVVTRAIDHHPSLWHAWSRYAFWCHYWSRCERVLDFTCLIILLEKFFSAVILDISKRNGWLWANDMWRNIQWLKERQTTEKLLELGWGCEQYLWLSILPLEHFSTFCLFCLLVLILTLTSESCSHAPAENKCFFMFSTCYFKQLGYLCEIFSLSPLPVFFGLLWCTRVNYLCEPQTFSW